MGDEGPLDVEFERLLSGNIKALKAFNGRMFPVRYPPKFYKDLLRDENSKFSTLGDCFALAGAFRMLERLHLLTTKSAT